MLSSWRFPQKCSQLRIRNLLIGEDSVFHSLKCAVFYEASINLQHFFTGFIFQCIVSFEWQSFSSGGLLPCLPRIHLWCLDWRCRTQIDSCKESLDAVLYWPKFHLGIKSRFEIGMKDVMRQWDDVGCCFDRKSVGTTSISSHFLEAVLSAGCDETFAKST